MKTETSGHPINRWYDADVGRWISEDPIGFAAGDANVYRYVANAATKSTDALGLKPADGDDADDTSVGYAKALNPVWWVRTWCEATDQEIRAREFRDDQFHRGFIGFDDIGGNITTSQATGYATNLANTSIQVTAAGLGGAFLRPAIPSKIQRDLGPRGWDPTKIDEAMRGGFRVPAINKANGNSATRYVHPITGQSIVVDNVTGEVIHVGGPGFDYGVSSGDLPLLPPPRGTR